MKTSLTFVSSSNELPFLGHLIRLFAGQVHRDHSVPQRQGPEPDRAEQEAGHPGHLAPPHHPGLNTLYPDYNLTQCMCTIISSYPHFISTFQTFYAQSAEY